MFNDFHLLYFILTHQLIVYSPNRISQTEDHFQHHYGLPLSTSLKKSTEPLSHFLEETSLFILCPAEAPYEVSGCYFCCKHD